MLVKISPYSYRIVRNKPEKRLTLLPQFASIIRGGKHGRKETVKRTVCQSGNVH